MRSIDAIENAALLPCEVLLQETFDIDDTFADTGVLRNAWQKTKFPDKLITFFTTLFNIKKSL